MPPLIDLGDTLGVKFTFFVNMGRAFDHRITLLKMLRRIAKPRSKQSIPAAKKLGLVESFRAVIFNPHAGRSFPAILQKAVQSGHEIGLHGGRNHAHWERSGHLWDGDQLKREVLLGCRWMAECGLPTPDAFASPAWNSPAGLTEVLRDLHFRVIADEYGADAEEFASDGGLLCVPTNITGQPGSAGYFETASLRHWSLAQTAENFRRQLLSKKKLAVVYDHPFFAGIHALKQVGELARIALDQGFSVCALSTAARLLQDEREPRLMA